MPLIAFSRRLKSAVVVRFEAAAALGVIFAVDLRRISGQILVRLAGVASSARRHTFAAAGLTGCVFTSAVVFDERRTLIWSLVWTAIATRDHLRFYLDLLVNPDLPWDLFVCFGIGSEFKGSRRVVLIA
jgi:hypothetical protein